MSNQNIIKLKALLKERALLTPEQILIDADNNCTLLLDEEQENYEFKIKGICSENTLVIKPERLLDLSKSFTGNNNELKKPDYLIFTESSDSEPLLLIIELKKTPISSGNSDIAYQLLGGLSIFKIIQHYSKLYYNNDLNNYFSKVGLYHIIVSTRKRRTKIDTNNCYETPERIPISKDLIQYKTNKIIDKEIYFKKILRKGKFVNFN